MSAIVLYLIPRFSDFEGIHRARYCGDRRQRGVFCPRCGFHIYEAWLIDRRETINLYLACVALIVYVSL